MAVFNGALQHFNQMIMTMPTRPPYKYMYISSNLVHIVIVQSEWPTTKELKTKYRCFL